MYIKNLRKALISITLASSLVLVGCTSEEQKAADEAAAAGDTAVANLNLTELPIGEKFKDPETDDEIEIVSIAHNFPVKDKYGDETYSLLKVTAKMGEKFNSYISDVSFQLSSDGGASWNYPESRLDEELKAAGFPVEEQSIGVGENEKAAVTRWYLLEIEEGATAIKGQYYRPEGKTFGDKKETVPEFIQEFPVPMN